VDDQPRDAESGRLSRRDLIRRGAIVGGSLIWVAPAIQSLTPAANAQTVGSPMFGCCECRSAVSPVTTPTEDCTGQEGTECTTTGSGLSPGSGPASSLADCQSYCTAKSKTYCFHTANHAFSCQSIGGGRSHCVGGGP
jgi:hypothetical protein